MHVTLHKKLFQLGRTLRGVAGRHRQAVFVVLGAALGLALASVVVTRSWVALFATSLAVTAILAGVVWELRRVRRAERTQRVRVAEIERAHDARITELRRAHQAAITGLRREHEAAITELRRAQDARVDQIEHTQRARLAALERAQAVLATHLYDQAKAARRAEQAPLPAQRLPAEPLPAELVPAELVPGVAGVLLERGAALEAYALVVATDSLPGLDLATLRRLRNHLRKRGYLGKALTVADACVDRSDSPRDRTERALIKGTADVLSGAWVPAVRAEDPGFTPRPGRVLHVVGNSLPHKQSGYTLRTHYTALAQRAAGLDPRVVTQMGFGHDGDDYAREEVDGITYHRIPGPARGRDPLDVWQRGNTQRLANVVRAVRPAVLHAASDFLNAQAALVVGREFGIPVVYESRGFWEETWLSRQAQAYHWDLDQLAATHGLPDIYLWRREIEDRCRREADRVVTLADLMADRIVAGGVAPDRISVIPNGVDAAAFPVLHRDAALAAKLGIAEDTTVIGYISSIVEYEGIDTLISAFAAVAADTPTPVKLLIVGDGLERERLMRQAADLGLHDDALFPGRVGHDAVLDYYSLIDIFVVPRKPVEVCHLVTPLKPFEAFATGRTVVLSNVRALARIAEQSRAAELFEAGDEQSLAETLRALLKDPQRRKHLADTGAAWVRAKRTWAANATTYLRLYEQLGAAPAGTLDLPQLPAEPADLARLRRLLADRDPIPFEELYSDDAAGSADSIMERGWSGNGHPAVSLDLPVEWTTLCMSNRSWNFRLHSWDFLDPVLRAFVATGDRRYLDWSLDRAASWAEVFNDGAARGTMAWYDMALGLRGHRLAYLVEQALLGGADSGTVRVLLGCVARHQREFLADHAFNSGNNHGFYVALGQLAMARRLRDLPGMDLLQRQGRERMEVMVRTQFAPDGGHREHSPEYHRMLAASFRDAIQAGLIDGDDVRDRVRLAEEVLGWFIQPNGEIAQVGDSPARQMRSGSPGTASPTTEFLVSTGARGAPAAETLRVLPDSGYAIVRSPQPQGTDDHEGASYLLLAAGFHSRTHKHADDLTVVWSDRGREILIDAGRYGYVDLLPEGSPLRRQGYFYGAPQRQYVESTRAHNTVAADGADHVRRGRAPYGSGLQDAVERDGHVRIRAGVDHGGWRHHREIIFRPGQWLQVVDTVAGLDGNPHDFHAWWNFPEELVPRATPGGLAISLPDAGGTLCLAEFSGAELVPPVTAQPEPLRGWRSKADRELTPAWSVGFVAEGVREHQFRTLFSFGGDMPGAPFDNPFDQHVT